MNIFAVHENPRVAAYSLCDKHVVKMPLESAQMLCTVLEPFEKGPYKPVFRKHPCTKWAAESKANFDWLVQHGIGLCEEYTRRYERRHKCQDVIEWAAQYAACLPALPLTPFAQAMPEVYKRPCSVSAYRAYYLGAKTYMATWKAPGAAPQWFSQALMENV